MMNDETIKLHAALLRHVKGMVTAYQRWLVEETESSEVENLKQLKQALTPLDTEKNNE